ncbi:MAG: DUF4400 domain-containing protein [Rhodoferax sp.]|jgi:hypothetical protein|nr:DUF4400 domain-containing protein [Rhodoferax sp.]
MIRATAVLSLVILLILVLYIPSAHPPQHFVAQIRIEHEATAAFWGTEPATRILARAVRMQDATAEITPIPKASDAPSTTGVNNAVAQEMASVNQRLFNNLYFRSIDALLLLGSYRLATLLEWLPCLAAFAVATVADGWFVRLIKAKEFVQHDPEIFAVYACLAIITMCATVVGFVVPITMHPLVLPCAPLVVSMLVGLAVGCFHRRG